MAGDVAAIRAGKAQVEMGLMDDPLRAGLNGVLARLRGFAGTLRTFAVPLTGLLSGAGIVGAVKHFAEAGAAMKEMSDRTGLTVEELSKLKFAAAMSGASVEDLEMGIKKMQKGGFGKGVEDLEKIADRIAAIEDPARRTQLALQIFGRGGTAMIPMLAEGAEGLRRWGAAADDAGKVMSGRTAESAKKLNQAFTLLQMQVSGVGMSLGAAFAPIILDVVTRFTSGLQRITGFIKENTVYIQDFGLAGAMAFVQLKAAWLDGMLDVRLGWIDFTNFLESNWIGTVALLQRTWFGATESIGKGLSDLGADFRNVFLLLKVKAGVMTWEEAAAQFRGGEKERDARLAAVKEENEAKQAAIAQEYNAKKAALEQDRLARRAAAEEGARDALDELDRMRTLVDARRKEALAGARAKIPGGGLADLGEAIGVGGSAQALLLSGIPAASPVLAEAKKTNDLLEDIRDELKDRPRVYTAFA